MYGGSSRARNTFCNGSGGHRYEDLGTPPYNADIEQLLEPSALGLGDTLTAMHEVLGTQREPGIEAARVPGGRPSRWGKRLPSSGIRAEAATFPAWACREPLAGSPGRRDVISA